MEQAIETGFGFCLGAAGVGGLVLLALVVIGRIQYRRGLEQARREQKQRSGAWLDTTVEAFGGSSQ